MRFSDRQSILFRVIEVPFYLVDLSIDAVGPDGSIDIRIASEMQATVYRLTINQDLPGGYPCHADAPGCALEKSAAANDGAIPLWGQAASFDIKHGKMRVGIKMDDLFGIGATAMTWLGFSTHAIEKNKPFSVRPAIEPFRCRWFVSPLTRRLTNE